jgi:hypothetical protein
VGNKEGKVFVYSISSLCFDNSEHSATMESRSDVSSSGRPPKPHTKSDRDESVVKSSKRQHPVSVILQHPK